MRQFFKGVAFSKKISHSKKKASSKSWFLKFKNLFSRKNLPKTLGIGLGIIIFFIVLLVAWAYQDLPSPKTLEKKLLSGSTKIYDRAGNLLYEIYNEKKRTPIEFSQMPDYLKKAIIATEDKNFYHHPGIDFGGIIRAFFHNLFYPTKIQGGSTLTQQFVKNSLLTSERTFTRKLKEAILSILVEQIYSKDEILAMYLNGVPFGANCYGIQAASQNYFGKDAKDLTLTESAAMAAITKAPTRLSPYTANGKKLLMERIDYVLDRMKEEGYITPEQAEQAKKEKNSLVFLERRESIKAPHFVMYIKDLLSDKYGEQMIAEGGLNVYTSLDPSKQQIAEEAVKNGVAKLKKRNVRNGALVAIDPKTGEVLAMVGSVDYWDKENDGNVNVALSDRQPGSSFKPYVYATAFMKGYSPATMLIDVLTDFGGGYKPKNYDLKTRGITDARHALAQSLNIPSVKMLYLAGIHDSIETAHKMGITTLNDESRYGLSLVLGSGEVKLLEHTSAFGVFAQNGLRHELHPILKITDAKGKVLEEYKASEDKGKQVLPAPIAYQITSILSDNQARAPVFGSNSALVLRGRPAAAKTGTTQDYKDCWTVGYTPSLVCGVWIGNNNNDPMDRVAGSIGAAPIWNEFMTRALAGTPVEQFTEPEGIVKMAVCQISGLKPSSHCNDGLKTEVFARDYNLPKERCSVHLGETKICTLSSKLATDNCPPETIETRNFRQLHCELPKTDPAYSRWEGPVASYAASAGYNIYAPTEQCHLHTGLNKPSIDEITIVPSNVHTGGSLTITVSASIPNGLKEFRFYLDNSLEPFTTTTSSTITYVVPSATIPGSHKIKVKVYDNLYYSAVGEKSFLVNPP